MAAPPSRLAAIRAINNNTLWLPRTTTQNEQPMEQFAVSLRPTGAESGADRFGSREHSQHPDFAIKQWRCNLTALSHSSNLFFVACGHTIHVFDPPYLSQRLAKIPLSIIRLPQYFADGRSGYIDPDHPHSINRILVSFLGNQEILLATCDDGDTVVYYLSAIEKIILRDVNFQLPEDVNNYPQPKTFFHHNSGCSAWGIAVHREARRLAISANTHEVTVISFALSSPSEDISKTTSTGDGHEQNLSLDQSYQSDQSDQSDQPDHTFTYLRAPNNVPHVAFCDEDPSGRWIMFGDISGNYHIYELRSNDSTPETCNVIRFCSGPNVQACLCEDRFSHSVWGTFWLDRRSFRTVPTVLDRLPDQANDVVRPLLRERLIELIPPRRIADTSDVFHKYSSNYRDMRRMRLLPPQPLLHIQQGPEQSQYDEEEEEGEEESNLQENQEHQDHQDPGSDSQWDDEEETDEDLAEVILGHTQFLEDHVSLFTGESVKGYTRLITDGLSRESQHIPSPIMIITGHDIFLARWNYAMGYHAPLKQKVFYNNELHHFSRTQMDRMNLHATIPELGVVVVASQKGRAIVLSLIQSFENEAEAQLGTPFYGMTADHILPLASQEEDGLRPLVPLAGIAANPIAERDDLPSDGQLRRWRLILTYVDFTILSYELSRPRIETEVDVESLVV
ncbi:hypothetical protein EJ05DRAFT_124517 [Pseudovirgaria hyperparasitica]|uniref:Uncharacterized protein n=1 Tax=Pseudovirgaria hyperparasitica TaxID=470096 RepID=A0A6A6VY85_9PEZI|nr:uncharacterized protein EJ05DRAFT_124517 [Pseudovirgaria hyperparasitica]KAF2755165.1 hypothetical protein EJ05DRAFT_124517 [Pseudovirgaria hyperparasitica]